MTPEEQCDPCAEARKEGLNPLLVVFFCPHCLLTGVFAAAAGGFITLPTIFGVGIEWVLPPFIILGGFATWLWWGRRARTRDAMPS